jgi:L-shaped tail fiber protein
MAIQMRRGAYSEFDPLKMKAGEWAVSTDSDTKKQQIWMCFAPGIVKRMGTVEDFDTEIQRLIQNYLDGMAQSVEKAQESAELAASKAQESANSASNAKESEIKAKASETNAKTSETSSAKSESEAQKYAEQAKEISESLSGALRPLGTINFADLPTTAEATSGDMYNIADQFTTTTDFKEGAGNIIPAGSNVYLTIDRYWDVLAGTPVTGVKGAKEVYYRRGNVNITPTDIGAIAEDGNISNTTVTFADTTTRVNLVSGEKASVGFRKIKKWFADLKSFAFKDLANNLTTTTTGSALDASQGKILNDKYGELNRSLGNLKTDFDKLNSIKIKVGTAVRTATKGENSFMLFTLEQVKNMFELESLSVNNIAILISNGDGKAFPSHLEGVTMLNNSWYVVFKDIVQGNMSCRVQYVIFYWGN